MPDDFKKVQTGDALHIPAPAYNAFIDAAIAQQRGLTLGGGTARRLGISGTVITAYNPTANDIPWHGAVEVLSTEQGEDITVGKSGDVAGVTVYGIALEQIAGSAYGAVALAGGPWKLTVAGSVAPGNQVGPVDGAWTAALAGTPTWEVLRRDTDGIALVRFFRPVVATAAPVNIYGYVTLNIANSLFIRDANPAIFSLASSRRQWTSTTSSTEIYRALFQFANPVTLDAVTNSLLLFSRPTSWMVHGVGLEVGHTDARMHFDNQGSYIAGVVEPFDVVTDSFSKLKNLSCAGGSCAMLWNHVDLLYNPHSGTTSIGADTTAAVALLSSLTVYGLRLMMPDKVLSVNHGTNIIGTSMWRPLEWMYAPFRQ